MSTFSVLLPILAVFGLAAGTCLDNGDKEIGGKCYKFVTQKLSFETARDWCHYQSSVPSYLAYVPDQFTSNFLASYARSSFGTNDGFFWIGLSRSKSYNPWTWDTGYQLSWSNFDGNQLKANFAAENIVNGKWATFDNSTELNFVCSYDPTAPPTFAPPVSTTTGTIPPSTPTTTSVPTTTEEEDEFCNIGEKHSTFLFAFATDFDTNTYNQARQLVISAISQNRHNYTKLANVRFDTKIFENITFHDDIQTFSADLNTKGPNGNLAADNSQTSNILHVIRSFLSATGRPLESSMIIILANRFPDISANLTDDELDLITNNNVKIYILNPLMSFNSQKLLASSRSSQLFSSLSANSNGHFIIADNQALVRSVQEIMARTYVQSLTFTRNLGAVFNGAGRKPLGTLKIPRSTSKTVKYYITVSVENSKNVVNTTGIYLRFSQAGHPDLPLYMLQSLVNSNFYFSDFPLQAGIDCQISYQSDDNGTNVLLRMWTESVIYHYGSFAALDDPMGGNPLAKVDEFNGAALRIRLMNDCYTDHAGSIIITDCNGQISSRYDAIQNIPTQFIFADEGSFPHYAFVPFFCDSEQVASTCITGTESKYDIQFISSKFTVIRSFQCRKGVGSRKCLNLDENGNYYCDRVTVPFRRGPTGQLVDCLGHGHLEFDFDDTQDYICVCDSGYTGESCEKTL